MSAQPGEKTYVALIPAYKPSFNVDEQACVDRYFRVLTGDIVFTVPEGLDLSWYEKQFPKAAFRRFPDKYFKGIRGYNKLLLSEDFYTVDLMDAYSALGRILGEAVDEDAPQDRAHRRKEEQD